METDKRTLIAIGLSLLIIMAWPYFFPYEAPKNPNVEITEIPGDSVRKLTETFTISQLPEKEEIQNEPVESIKEKKLLIVDDIAERILTNRRGVRFFEYDVKKHKDRDGNYVRLINDQQNNGYTAELTFRDGTTEKLSDYTFEYEDSTLQDIVLSESNKRVNVRFKAKIRDKYVYQTYTFYYNAYDYDLAYDFREFATDLAPNGVKYLWQNGMPYTEINHFEDENMSLVFMWGDDDLHRFDTDDPEDNTVINDSKFNYFVVRSKYFMSAVIPTHDEVITALDNKVKMEKRGENSFRKYDVSFDSNKANASFKIYVGPYELSEMEKYADVDLDEVFLNASSYEGAFRWITHGVHFMLLQFQKVFGNYGLAIIFFTIFIKLILFPLTKKSYQGMSAMKELQPKMQKIKEKYGDDPQMQQKKMMQLYQEEKINPLGGCLPMLLQMPLLLALFQVFRAAIEFRGASFLWIQDFASPDAFPMEWLGVGLVSINLLPILLAVSQVLTSKQTMTDPNQKMLVYIMPVMFLFLFYNWNAALNFYYLLFNILTTIQQKLIHRPEEEKEVKVEASPSGFLRNDKASRVQVKKKDNMYRKK